MSNSHRFDHLATYVLEHPWAIERQTLTVIATIIGRRLAGLEANADDIAYAKSRAAARILDRPTPAPGRGIAVLPVHGVIAPRMNLFSEASGGTTYEDLRGQLASAVADPNVGTIVLDVDSPGGNIAGADEFAADVMAARAQKPIVAVAEYAMCSAAYWAGSCATEVVASPSALVGGVGVYAIHDDLSEALAQLGVKRTYISRGDHKIDAPETSPLSPEAKARIQGLVDHSYAAFTERVAKGRGVPVAQVRGGFGQGAPVTADDALGLGMIDRVETLDATLTRLAGAPPLRSSLRAAATPAPAMADTPQEPARVTGQDQAARAAQNATMRALAELSLGF